VQGSDHAVFPATESDATVVLFAATDCPISNYFAPEVERIRAAYEPRGIEFLLVYADRDESEAAIAQHLTDFSYGMPGLLDFDHELVRHTGATMTPEAVVLSSQGEVLYRGRIDDTYVAYGKQRAEPSRRDLRLALDDVLAGREVAVGRTDTVGCFIPEPLVEGTDAACCEPE